VAKGLVQSRCIDSVLRRIKFPHAADLGQSAGLPGNF
jgi:hypothetical protein